MLLILTTKEKSSCILFYSVQWWADGGASEAPLRRHLYRQLQPLPQTNGREEVSELSPNRKEKVGIGPVRSDVKMLL